MMNIAIAGKAGSGKSTAANRLVSNYGYERRALATPLKAICALHPRFIANPNDPWVEKKLCRLVDDLLLHSDADEAGMLVHHIMDVFISISPTEGKNRELLQAVGTDLVRHFVPDAWVNYLLQQPADVPVVVDDVRFRNEFYGLKSSGWVMVYCHCPAPIRAQRLQQDYGRHLTPTEAAHPSEVDLDSIPLTEWDWVINSGGSMIAEIQQVDELMAHLMEVEQHALCSR